MVLEPFIIKFIKYFLFSQNLQNNYIKLTKNVKLYKI